MLARNVNDFFDDKRRLCSYVENLSSGSEKVKLDELNHYLKLGEKWKLNSTFYRSIDKELLYLNNLAEFLNSNYESKDRSNVQKVSISKNNLLELEEVIGPQNDTKPFNKKQQQQQQQQPPQIYQLPESNDTSESNESGESKGLPSSSVQSLYTSENSVPLLPEKRFTPSAESISNFFDYQGVVGEEANCELLLYATLAKNNVGIESLAGSGKSVLLYALLEAIPKERYHIIHQATARSLYQDKENKNVDFWVIPELQKIFTKDIEEIIKNLTEGVSTTYTRTNSKRDGVDSFEIKKKAVLYSLAITNKHLKERDDELARRFIILHTDISKNQNKNVALMYAENELFDDNSLSLNNTDLFKKHIAQRLNSNCSIKNPFLPYLVQTFPEKITSQIRFRSSVKYLQNLIQGSTLFYQPEQDKFIFSTLDDVERVITLYEKVLIDNLYGLSVIDRAVLDLVSEFPEGISMNNLESNYSEKYPLIEPLKKSVQKLSLASLINNEGKEIKSDSINIQFDNEKAFGVASMLMEKYFPNHFQEWFENNSNQIGGKNE